MVFSRNCALKGRDSYPFAPEGPTTLEWLAGENIALRAEIEELNAALQRQEEQIRVYTDERNEVLQATEDYHTRIAHELSTSILQLKIRAEEMLSSSSTNLDEICRHNLVMIYNGISQVTDLLTTMEKIRLMEDMK